MKKIIARIVELPAFEYAIIAVILINAVIIGMETSPELATKYAIWFKLSNQIILGIFILEAAMKIYAVSPQISRYFTNGWNIFDFSIIILSLIPFTGDLAMIARLARLLRVLRLISVIPELRLIVATLMRSIPSMGNIMLLMSVIFYIFAIAGQQLFHEHDPTHWETLGISLLTLFRIVTLEDWTDVMYTAMEMNPYSWIYFVAFVIMGTFVVINLFIAVVINNLEEAKQEHLDSLRQPVNQKELAKELEQTQQALKRLQQQLESNQESVGLKRS